jgi:xanthine dehydrogenase molybdopterin-binding subunit B
LSISAFFVLKGADGRGDPGERPQLDASSVGCTHEGQIQGGVAQGIGGALNEEYIYDTKGRLDNARFLDYRVPVASDMPMIEPILVEVPNPAHPFGAKGVGEVNIVLPMARSQSSHRSG